VDIFAGCLDQVGLLEMKSMVNSSGGIMVLSDSFTTLIFKQSFQKMFEKDAEGHLKMGFNATLAVQVGIMVWITITTWFFYWALNHSFLFISSNRQPRSSRSVD
jgi:hypothetical protein